MSFKNLGLAVLILCFVASASATNIFNKPELFDNKEFKDTIFIPGDTIFNIDTIVLYEEIPFVWKAGIYFAPAFPIVKHNGNGDPVLDELVKNEFRLGTSYMFGATVNLGYLDWNLESGLNMYLLNEKFDYEGSNEFIIEKKYEYEIPLDTSFLITETDTFENIVYIMTDSTNYVTEYLPSPQLNKFLYFEIPFGFSHTYSFKKLNFDINLAIISGILLNKNRRNISYNAEYEFTDLSKHNALIHTNFSIYIGSSINYQFTPNIALYIEPFYRQSLNPVLKTNNPVSVIPRMLGLKTGIKFQF